ncbi:hypothetical protein PQX77_003887 [Marasmius sp. AFHP31]|nr:hypothetical protein PQX77_003887 [Marasmius sp. AFHP31]
MASATSPVVAGIDDALFSLCGPVLTSPNDLQLGIHDVLAQKPALGQSELGFDSIDLAYTQDFDRGVFQQLFLGEPENVQPSVVDRKSLVVANIRNTLGDKKMSLLSTKLTRTYADVVDFMVKAEVAREALRTPVTAFKQDTTCTAELSEDIEDATAMYRRVVLELSEWSNARFTCWKKRSESVAALGARNDHLRIVGQALAGRLTNEGINHQLVFASDIPGAASTAEDTIFLENLTAKGLDAIIKEVKTGTPLSRPVKLDLGIVGTPVDETESKNAVHPSTFQAVFRVSDLTAHFSRPRQKRKKTETNSARPKRQNTLELPPNYNQDIYSLVRRTKAKHTHPPSSAPSCSTSNVDINDPSLLDVFVLTSLVGQCSDI